MGQRNNKITIQRKSSENNLEESKKKFREILSKNSVDFLKDFLLFCKVSNDKRGCFNEARSFD